MDDVRTDATRTSQGQEDPPAQQRQQAVSHLHPLDRDRDRVARVEALRQKVATGTYHIDSADLALCILRNTTRFVES